ncbi:hypothetical protein [Celeribacter ethanolicus]|uniref:hypothetical protein n=1 Tax=Celeribacter ethanolicus TaxID=1758178 RepID=UPI00138F0625|nr:hypothetical protein [Celeribacter ethanolicus]
MSDLSTLHQDTAMTIPVTMDGDPVGAVRDKRGQGLYLRQSTASSRPTLAANALSFDGVDDYLVASVAGYPGIREVHVATTLPPAFVGDAYQGLFGARTQYNTQISYLVVAQVAGVHQLWAGAGTTQLKISNGIAALMGTRCVLGYSHDGSTVRLFVNGVQIGATGQSGSAAGTLSSIVGGINAGGGLGTPYSGQIEGVVEFDRLLSDTERGQIVQYLAA